VGFMSAPFWRDPAAAKACHGRGVAITQSAFVVLWRLSRFNAG
jgi:hypothetical protein